MSVDNSELLMLLGGKKSKQTIGVQGEIGFGGGVYGGDPSDLKAIGLSPMPNNDDPLSENYGSYKHTNGSVMLFVPAFCYRIGNSSAPSYSRDGDAALEIRDALEMDIPTGSNNSTWVPKEGFILHRAFVDGGILKRGFFVDKYLCSKDSTGKLAISVKNGNPICTDTSYIDSSSMPGCEGKTYDVITLGRARGDAYACISAFQWSALAMLSLAHGQAAKSTEACAWFDPNYQTNFPKGNNNYLKDINDSSLSFTLASGNSDNTSLTGSANNIAKTTHTGQVWGVTDINGNKYQPLLGLAIQSDGFRPAKEAVKVHDFTNKNYSSADMYGPTVAGCGLGKNKNFGNGKNRPFFTETSGTSRALCGVVPTSSGYSSSGTKLFGNDLGFYSNYGSLVVASGMNSDRDDAGVWHRFSYDRKIDWGFMWEYGSSLTGFRVAGYAN